MRKASAHRPSATSGGMRRDESVKQVELVLGIVDEVDAACTGHYGEPEQRASAGRCEQRRRYLRALRGRFDNVSVAAVYSKDIAVGRESKSKRRHQRAASAHCLTRSRARVAKRRVRNP